MTICAAHDVTDLVHPFIPATTVPVLVDRQSYSHAYPKPHTSRLSTIYPAKADGSAFPAAAISPIIAHCRKGRCLASTATPDRR
jgi:hypothetical protein